MYQISKKIAVTLLLLLVGAFTAVGCNYKTTDTPANISTSSISTPVEQPITYQGVEGKSALELLKEKYQVQTKNFEGIGEFVESINSQVSDTNHFWAFYINGQSSQVGAGQYQTKPGDTIEWKLEEIKQ